MHQWLCNMQWGLHVNYRLGRRCQLGPGARPSLKACTIGVAHRLGGSEFQSVVVRGKQLCLYVSVHVLSCLYM